MMHNEVQNELERGTTGSGRARRGARLLGAGAGLALVGLFLAGTGAGAAECPPGTNPWFGCSGKTSPWLTPTAPVAGAPVRWLPPVGVTPVTAPPVTLPPVTVPPVTVPPVTLPPATVPAVLRPARAVPEAALRLLDLANGERQRAGLGSLTARDDVTAIALAHSHRMASAGNIFHSDGYFSATTRRLLNSAARGENVAHNTSVDDAHARLMNSPGHRANLLNGRFSVVGFAVVQGSDGRYFITQDFLTPAGPPPGAVAPRPAAKAPARAVTARPTAPTAPAAPRPVVAPSPPVAELAPPPAAPAVPDVPSTVLASPRPIAATQAARELSPPLSALALVLLSAAMGASWWVLHQLRSS